MARKRVKKSEIKKELTDITVEEVSLVDVPANQRKFLVVKDASGGAAPEAVESAPADVQKEEAPAAPEASKDKPVVETQPAADPVAEEVHKEEALAPAAELVAEDVQKDEGTDISISADTVVINTDAISSPPYVYQAHMGEETKKAVSGVLTLIRQRVDALESMVASALPPVDGGERVDWEVLYRINEICSFACEASRLMESMQGATWEVQIAAVAALAKSLTGSTHEERVEKVGRALSKDRLDTLKGIHTGMDDCLKQLKSFIKTHDSGVEKSAAPDLTGELEAAKARIGELEEVNKSLRQKLDEPARPNAGTPVPPESRSTMNKSFPRAWVGGKRI